MTKPRRPPDVALSELFCCVQQCVLNGSLTSMAVDDDLLARAKAACNLAYQQHPWLGDVVIDTGNYDPGHGDSYDA